MAEARALEAKTSWGRGFVAAWAWDNHRSAGANSGYRTLEHILAPEECRGNGSLISRPDLSADDYEVAEALVLWLSTEDGKRYFDECELEIRNRALAEDVARAVERGDFKAAKRLLSAVEV